MSGVGFADLRYPLPVRTLRLGALEIALCDQGSGVPAVLLLHGLGSYLPVWSRTLPALCRRHRTVAIDLPGYGKSSKGDHPYSMAFFVDVVEQVIEALGLRRLVLCGHSMGGQIALCHALRRPGRAEALLLLAPAGLEPFSAQEREQIAALLTEEALRTAAPAVVRAAVAANFTTVPPEAASLIEDRLAIIGGPDHAAFARAAARSVRGMLEAPVLDRLHEVHVPTLVLFGEQDRYIPNPLCPHGTTRELAERGAARLPRGELVILPGAGHMAHFEQPEVVNAHLLDFLRRQTAPCAEAPPPEAPCAP